MTGNNGAPSPIAQNAASGGGFRCNMLTGALVPRRGTVAGVPGPRRSADECDAGWFAPVATRRRSSFRPAHRYSVLRNSAIATVIIPRPMIATMAMDSQSGTSQPAQVMPGASCCPNAAGMLRWLKTAWRIGPTM